MATEKNEKKELPNWLRLSLGIGALMMIELCKEMWKEIKEDEREERRRQRRKHV